MSSQYTRGTTNMKKISVRTFVKRHETNIGSIASVLAIVMFIALIEIALSNFRGESHIVIQPTMTALSGGVWSLYAYGRRDWFLLVPNVLALFLGSVTVIVAYL